MVWLQDQHGRLYYYAHLHRWAVRPGEIVRPGDTVGFVGNSGNAEYTPSHLHFGVYIPGVGPVDPARVLSDDGPRVIPRGSNPNLVGTWARVTGMATLMRAAPSDSATEIARLPRGTPVQVRAETGRWYLARLAGVGGGYVSLRDVAPLGPGSRRAVAAATPLLTAPAAGGIAVDSLPAGTTVRVLARYADYFLVQREDSATGWIGRAAFTPARTVARTASPAPVDLTALADSLRHVRVPLAGLLSPGGKRK